MNGDPKRNIIYGTIITTPESIVRQHRIQVQSGEFGVRSETKAKPSLILEKILKAVLLITLGWAIGYAHHFLAG